MNKKCGAWFFFFPFYLEWYLCCIFLDEKKTALGVTLFIIVANGKIDIVGTFRGKKERIKRKWRASLSILSIYFFFFYLLPVTSRPVHDCVLLLLSSSIPSAARIFQ